MKRIHKVEVTPIRDGDSLTHRSECVTCGTVLALHAREEDAEMNARDHAIERSGLLEVNNQLYEHIIRLDLQSARSALHQADQIRSLLKRAGITVPGDR